MKRLLALSGALLLGMGVLAPVVLAGEPMPNTGRVLISTQGDVTIPAGDQADVVVVVQGNVDIRGDVNTLVVVEGTANLSAAHLQTVVVVRSQVEVGDGTVIDGELQRLDSTVHQTGNVTIGGGITDLSGVVFEASAVLAPALVLLWIGFGLASIVAALLLAGMAARQVREAERLISTEPLMTGLIGFVGLIVIPVSAILLMITVIGIPLGLGVLFQVLPLLAYAGYLVAAIWVGEWILRRSSPTRERERPFLAAVIGVVVLGAIGVLPIIGLIGAIASLLGFGALILMAFRTLGGASRPAIGAPLPAPSPTGA